MPCMQRSVRSSTAQHSTAQHSTATAHSLLRTNTANMLHCSCLLQISASQHSTWLHSMTQHSRAVQEVVHRRGKLTTVAPGRGWAWGCASLQSPRTRLQSLWRSPPGICPLCWGNPSRDYLHSSQRSDNKQQPEIRQQTAARD